MFPEPGTVLHFSEDPSIVEFVPHVAATARQQTPLVWAVGRCDAPSYWFPRQCPRAMAWVGEDSTEDDRVRLLGPGVRRVHLIEYGWLTALQNVELYAYAFDDADFVPFGDPRHAMVADHPVRPLGPPQPVVDLLRCHADACIEVRLVRSLWPWWQEVITSSLGHSGIRLANAYRPTTSAADGRPGHD